MEVDDWTQYSARPWYCYGCNRGFYLVRGMDGKPDMHFDNEGRAVCRCTSDESIVLKGGGVRVEYNGPELLNTEGFGPIFHVGDATLTQEEMEEEARCPIVLFDIETEPNWLVRLWRRILKLEEK